MICVILEEGELTKTVSQKTVTVILLEGERYVVKKKTKPRNWYYYDEFHWSSGIFLTIIDGRERDSKIVVQEVEAVLNEHSGVRLV